MNALIIIPAYNEEASIESVVRSVQDKGYDYVVVNDGSKDRTLDICKSNGFNVIDLPRNLGIGGAIQTGHKYAFMHGYDVDVQFDGDGQHDLGSVSALLGGIESGADLVIGSRFISEENTFRSARSRRAGIRLLNTLIKLRTGQNVTDCTSGFRACGRKAIELFAREYPRDYPEPESIAYGLALGLDVCEVPVVMHERQGGRSSINLLSSIYYMIKVSIAILIAGRSRKRERGRG